MLGHNSSSKFPILFLTFHILVTPNPLHEKMTALSRKLFPSIGILFAICLLIPCFYTNAEPVELTEDSFDDIVKKSGKNVFVKFHQVWCGHCKRMKPDWNKLSDAMAQFPNVIIADVDCGEHHGLCEDQEVMGYPTLKYFIKGEEHKYENARSFEAMRSFAMETLKERCIIHDLDNTCRGFAKEYASKWMSSSTGHDTHTTKEVRRLEKMVENPNLTESQKGKFMERIDILKQIVYLHVGEEL